ncbi:MAG: response regulator [Acidobacteriota bacterium]
MSGTHMKRILFVDDEPKVLHGLQRLLRPMRHEWEMAFAEGGSQALQLLASQPFDVVVSDMRMPGIDGAALLTEVMRRYPNVVRIILSGQSDRDLILRSMGCMHQFLSKPCEAQVLKGTISRAFALRDLLASERLKQLVLQIQTLPSLPSLYVELTSEMQSAEPSMTKVADIISRDIGMTAKVLQLVNSAFYGLREQVSSPAAAVNLLGVETIKALVLSLHVFSQFDQTLLPNFSLAALWSHSLRVGDYACKIFQLEQQMEKTSDSALIAGLLHDSGKLILAANLPRLYEEALSVRQFEHVDLEEAERRVFGASHAEVGAYLLSLWGLPDAVIEAVAFHHQPMKSAHHTFKILTAVYAANVIEHQQTARGFEGQYSELNSEYLTQLGVTSRQAAWQELCR